MTGRLLSVNVGLPQDLTWHGRTVYTAVWKKPVEGPVQVRWLNIDGDGQGDLAGHGGEQRAVFVYQIESYQYWQDQLGRDDFEYGQFGENFTVAGLGDDQVCIGDRYRIGEAVFEVTQPRVTCYRVGIRMNDPQIPALLVSHHRPGFYLRVLREGAVQAGDDIVPVATGPQAMTVAETDALLYLPGHPRKQLLRALRIPALSPGWKASFRAMLDQPEAGGAAEGNAGLTAVSPPPAWPGFRPLTVTAVERETDSIVSVRLAEPGGAAVPAALPGQFLVLRLPVNPGQPPLLRSYSLSGPPGAAAYRVSVKREPQGAGSQFIYSRVRAGDVLEAAAPRGTFTLRPGQEPVLLISAGVGAGHAARPGRRQVRPRHLVAARRPQPGRRAVRRGVTLAADDAGQRAPAHLLQPPGPGRCPGARLSDDRADVGGRAGRGEPSAQRRCLYLRSGRIHGRGIGRPRRPRCRRQPGAHRDLRRRALPNAWHRRHGHPPPAPASG
jgi:MOSC domain-containing protein YiiM